MEIDIITLIRELLGDKAAYALVSLSIIGYIWCQVRQLISPKLMAKLPAPLISFLEFAAGNRGLAANNRYCDPKEHKRELRTRL